MLLTCWFTWKSWQLPNESLFDVLTWTVWD